MTADMELLLVAGEASGDLHGSSLMEELARRQPRLGFFGLGGDRMVERGLEAVAHSREIAIVGIFEGVGVVRRAWQIYRQLLEQAAERRPRAAVLIDSPEFNLILARGLNRLGIRVIYYVSPQIWAWRRRRVRIIARTVERMLVLFPFEVPLYEGHGVSATLVGHPLVDEVPELEQAWDRPQGGEGRRLVLLPGSRDGEVKTLLPQMLGAAERLMEGADLEVSLVQAASVDPELVASILERTRIPVEVVTGDRFEVVARSHLALCASGTATLEVGLLRTPLIVLYRVNLWTSLIGRMLVRVPYISLVNLVLERPAVPEMVQSRARPAAIAAEARRLLGGGEPVESMRSALAELRPRLGRGGAAGRAAEEVLEVIT